MTIENLALFRGLGARLDFLNQRQRVISQNVANSDTPGYKPKDLVPADFGDILKAVDKGGDQGRIRNVTLQKTSAGHTSGANDLDDPDVRRQKETYEVAPTGNAVVIEEQLLSAGETVAQYTLVTNLLQKNVGMIRTALGRV